MALAVGLAGYAAWRVVEAILDTESKGSDPKGIAARLVYAGIGATYAALALSALRLGLQWADGDGGGGDASARDWTAWLMSFSWGVWLVGLLLLALGRLVPLDLVGVWSERLVGVAIVGVGVWGLLLGAQSR